MATIAYHKAFSIELRHEYFTDEFAVNEKLELIPTASCEQLLAHGRMVFRKTGKGGLVMYRSENPVPGSPTVQLSGTQVFNFKLKLNDATQFMNVTELNLSGTYTPARPIFLKAVVNNSVSANTPTQLSVEFLDGYRPSRFAETYLLTGGNNTLQVTDISGSVVSTQTINSNVAVQKQLPVDLSGFAPGYYTVTFTDSLAAVTSRKYFVGDEVTPGESLAMLSIAYTGSQIAQLYDDGAIFEYEFLAKNIKWRYYIVARQIDANYPFDKLILKATSLTEDSPPEFNFFESTSNPNPNFSFGGIHPIIYESSSNILIREKYDFELTLQNIVKLPIVTVLSQVSFPDHSAPSANPARKEVVCYADRLITPN
jgi:hypothetical protein